jgi:hypothetical protein
MPSQGGRPEELSGTGDEEELFIVISGWDDPPWEGCRIVPKGFKYVPIYRKFFGPDTRENCERFVQTECKSYAPEE